MTLGLGDPAQPLICLTEQQVSGPRRPVQFYCALQVRQRFFDTVLL
jgi:hypothetical protein